jgi:hypothetical protein
VSEYISMLNVATTRPFCVHIDWQRRLGNCMLKGIMSFCRLYNETMKDQTTCGGKGTTWERFFGDLINGRDRD